MVARCDHPPPSAPPSSPSPAVYQGGQPLPVDGTSCSTPIFSGIISLANAARIAAGKKVLGFVNPAIYTIGAAGGPEFTDITGGAVNK